MGAAVCTFNLRPVSRGGENKDFNKDVESFR